MHISLENTRAIARQYHPATVQFAQDLVSIPSLPGQETDVAAAVSNEMTQLGYDEVWTDRAGNIIGKINGAGGPAIILNGHMDHVDPGRVESWPYPPFAAHIVDDELWGRGAVDMKGPVACMIYAASFFKQLGLTPPGDIYVAIAVMEEIGGLGTQYLAAQLPAQAAICGEPSQNILRRGHRGRVELQVKFQGQSAHASVPHLGCNPHYGAAAFLQALPTIALATDAVLGHSTVVPTLYHTDQVSPNVIPGEAYLTLDWRTVPAESPETVVAKVKQLLDDCLRESAATAKLQTSVAVTRHEFITYTGLVQDLPSISPSFLLAEDHPILQAAQRALVKALGRDDGARVWRFATDGGHLMAAGIPTIGFGPGDDTLAHTNRERISLHQMEEALIGYVALMQALFQSA